MDSAGTRVKDAAAPPAVVEFSDSRLCYAVILLIMVTLGVVTVPTGLGLVGGLYFGGFSVWALVRMIDKRPRLFITEEGVLDRTYWSSPGLIRWDEILDFEPAKWGMIRVRLRDEQAFWERLPTRSRFVAAKTQLMRLGPAVISGWALERSRSELLDALEAGADAHALREVSAAAALGRGDAPT